MGSSRRGSRLGDLVAIGMATAAPSDNSVVTEGSNDPVVTGGDTVVTEVAPVVTEVGRVVVEVDPVVTDASSATSGYMPVDT